MTGPTVHGKRRALSASSIREAIASDLMQIKQEDRLTFADMGRVLGKSEDQAAKYCDGTAVMDAITYTFARDTWNGRFTGTVDTMIAGRKAMTCDHSKQSKLLAAALALSVALEDGEITDEEVRSNRKTLEHARDAIEALLSRVKPRKIG